MTAFLDRGHHVLCCSLDLLFALPHLLDLEISKRRSQVTAELADRVVDHFRPNWLRLQPVEEPFFEMIVANAESAEGTTHSDGVNSREGIDPSARCIPSKPKNAASDPVPIT